MKFIGQYIQDFIARFRSDVYLEDVSSGTIASGGNLGLDSNNKIVKADVPADGDITTITIGDTTTTSPILSGDATVQFLAGEGVDVALNSVSANVKQITYSGEDASTSNKGVASFSSDNFAASSGAITIKDGGVDLTAEVTGVLPSANLDADTAHLSTTQTFTGAKTFDETISGSIDGNAATVTSIGNLTGDVTSSNRATTIAADAVTYAKMQNLGTANRVLGSTSTGVIGEVQIVEEMIADNAVTEDKIADAINSAIAANTAKNTNVSTNLTATTHASQITINSSDGDNVVVAEASGSIAGVMTVAHHDKLDGIEASATADQTKSDIDGLAITTVGTLDTGDATAIVSAASATAAGKVELATTAEATTGTDTSRAVTAAGVAAVHATAQTGRNYRIINTSFRQDIGTTKYYLPFKSQDENVTVHREEVSELAVCDGRVVSVTLRVENVGTHSGDANVTFGVTTNVVGSAYSTFTEQETETLAINDLDDHHLFHYVFSDAKHWDSTDMFAISIQSDTDISGSNERFYITVVIEDGWESYLGGSSREIDSTP